MKRRMGHVAAAIVVSVLLAGCATSRDGRSRSTVSAPATSRPSLTATPLTLRGTPTLSTRHVAVRACDAALSLGYGPAVSPVTGEHGVVYTLTNRGATSCTLVGYPGITLYDAAGAAMPFHYTHGHSQYVTWAPPMTVTLRPRTVRLPAGREVPLRRRYRPRRGHHQDRSAHPAPGRLEGPGVDDRPWCVDVVLLPRRHQRPRSDGRRLADRTDAVGDRRLRHSAVTRVRWQDDQG